MQIASELSCKRIIELFKAQTTQLKNFLTQSITALSKTAKSVHGFTKPTSTEFKNPEASLVRRSACAMATVSTDFPGIGGIVWVEESLSPLKCLVTFETTTGSLYMNAGTGYLDFTATIEYTASDGQYYKYTGVTLGLCQLSLSHNAYECIFYKVLNNVRFEFVAVVQLTTLEYCFYPVLN